MAVIFKKLTATLPAGSNTHTFTDNLINANSVIEVYCDNDDVYPTDIYMSNTNAVTVEYSDHAEEVHIALTINNAESFEPYDDTDIVEKYYEVKTDVLNVEARTEMVEGAVNDLGIRVANNSSRIQYAVVLSETASREVNDAIENGYISIDLFNGQTDGYSIGANGSITANTNNAYDNFMDVKNYDKVYLYHTRGTDLQSYSEVVRIHGYNDNQEWIRQIQHETIPSNDTSTHSIVINTSDVSYIQISKYKSSTDVIVTTPSNTDLQTSKQDKLTAGSGITITNNVISATGGGGGGDTHTYSTEEQIVGTWVDGKPIYERTVTGIRVSYSSSSETNVYDVSTWGIKDVIEGTFRGPSSTSASDTCVRLGIMYLRSNDYLGIYYGGSGVITGFTVRYTKTTD